jgi:predicted phage terminase large subunit-like protein
MAREDSMNAMNNVEKAIFEELDRREAAASRLALYAGYSLGVTPAAHHRLMCDAVDDMWSPTDPYDELIICLPPGGAKSTYISHALSAYFLGRFPDENIILATHTADLAERWSRQVRDTVSSAEHQRVFPTSTLSKDATAVGRWATTKGGEFLAAGVGGAILGFRAKLAVIDDPVKDFEQAQSMTQLQKIHDWYETSFLTRLKPGGRVVIVCQRLSPNDLAGYMIQRNIDKPTRRQRVLILPMECEDPATDPLHRQLGERLWPEWFTQEMVEDAKRDNFKWRTLYQQKPPSEEGSWVSPSEIRIVDIVPASDNLQHYIVSDLALSVNSGDYSVHIVCGIDSSHNAYVLEAWRDRCDPNVTAGKHLALTDAYRPVECLIDDDNASKVYVQLLASKARQEGIPIPWKALPIRGQDKETRAAALRGMFKRGLVYLKRADWNAWLVKELLSFPNALGQGVDDGVDALSLLGRRLASLASASPPTPPPKPVKYAYEATLNELWEDRERSHYRTKRI